MDKSSQVLLVVFIGISALSLFLQAAFTVGMALGVGKALKKVTALVDDVRLHAMPAVIASRELVQELTPKVRVVSDDLVGISHTLRAKTDELAGLVGDVTGRAHVQASRVDGIVKGTLDQLNSAVLAIEHGVAAPIRQVNGILSGLRAGVDVLRKKAPSTYETSEAEEDLFV